jgi:hypothetical protein
MRAVMLSTLILAACSADKMPGNGSGSGSGTTLSTLTFAVVGDTRPPIPDDTIGYPTDVITKIYQDIVADSPQFVVATGDYMFASTFLSEQQPQLDKYMGARAAFTGKLYPAMGNHECNGATDSNCASSPTKNMTAFIDTMLSPIGETKPYYTEAFSATDNSWTAKFVFVACNAWDSTQASWLDQELANSTTYTFVVRHESTSAVSGTPCPASDATINAHPVTLRIVGHSHFYSHQASSKEIIVGNGGAPLTSGNSYGYVMISRNDDGTLTVTSYDYMTHASVDTFKIQASGAGA